MVTYFVSTTYDKDRGWAAPSDESGKIFTYTRLWACHPQDSTSTYDQAEHLKSTYRHNAQIGENRTILTSKKRYNFDPLLTSLMEQAS
jgi:hypothetical protein